MATKNVLGTGQFAKDIQLVASNIPDAPTLSLVAGSRTATSIKLQFGPGADNGGSEIVGYRLYRNQGTSNSPMILMFDGINRPEMIVYEALNLTSGKTFQFELETFNAAWFTA